MIILARGLFSKTRSDNEVNAFEMVNVELPPAAIPAKVKKVRIGPQMGVQMADCWSVTNSCVRNCEAYRKVQIRPAAAGTSEKSPFRESSICG